MADERPISLKRSSESLSNTTLTCIVHYDRCRDDEIAPLSESQFHSIQNAVQIRQAQCAVGHRLDDICQSVPSVFVDNIHGVHRWCYKNFTNISRLISTASQSGLVESVSKRRCSSRTPDSRTLTALFPQDKCIFCDRPVKQLRGTKEFLSKCVTEDAESRIKQCATEKSDYRLLGIIEGQDLRAREARYHESCRRDYVRKDSRSHHSAVQEGDDDDIGGDLTVIKAAHADSFKQLCEYVQENIISAGQVERMSMLRMRYINYIAEKYPDCYNPDYPTQKLKTKLVGQFGEALQFWLPKASCKSELVYSSAIDIGEAVECAFDASASNTALLSKAAVLLSNSINTAFSTSQSISWPPSVNDLQTVSPPTVLTEFLCKVIAGPNIPKHKYTEKITQVAESLSEDLCYAATRGKWAMPKHTQLALSLHHLTGSAEVITLLNRFGHCQSYSKLLELETAMAHAIQASDSVLPSNISQSGNLVTHTCWDNFDLNEETPSGSGTTHTTHGIVIQELSPTCSPHMCDPVECPKSKSRSFQYVPPSIEPVVLGKKMEPNLTVKTTLSYDEGVSSFLSSRGLMWVVAHSFFNSQASVPDWSGWLSKTSELNPSHQQSNIGYLRPILQPITQAATVQQCLLTSQAVSEKLGQKYTFITFDLAAAKLAYNVIWGNPTRFPDTYVHLGAFHIICCFLGAVGRMMIGSGFEEIVIESGICSSGSIDQVLSGKHYNRALRVHQLMAITLDKLLLQEFVERTGYDMSQLQELQLVASCPCNENMSATEDSDSWRSFSSQFLAFADAARQGTFGRTCQFWMQYHDSIWLLLTFLQSIKENNLPAYVSCLRLLCPMIFAADRVNYARFLPLYYVQLSQLIWEYPDAHKLLENKGISVSRSDAPAYRNAIDITIEQTINRSAKTSGGIIGFSRNVSAYYRWCVTRHQRAAFLEATRDRVGINRCSPNTCRKSDLKHMEKDVQRVHQAFQNFSKSHELLQ